MKNTVIIYMRSITITLLVMMTKMIIMHVFPAFHHYIFQHYNQVITVLVMTTYIISLQIPNSYFRITLNNPHVNKLFFYNF